MAMTVQTKSKKYDMVKKYYNGGNGLWKLSRVKVAVKVKAITEAEYKEITGLEYDD